MKVKQKLKFLNEALEQQKGTLMGIIIISIIDVIIVLMTPMVFRVLIDNIIGNEVIENNIIQKGMNLFGGVDFIRDNIWIGALIVVLITVIRALETFVRTRLNGKISTGVEKTLRDRMYHHIVNLPYSFHVTSSTGDLIQRSTSDVNLIRRVFGGQVSQFVYTITMTIIALTIMFSINRQLSLIALVLLPLIFLFAILYFNKVKEVYHQADEAESAVTTSIQESLSAVRVVKAFNNEQYEFDQFDKKSADYSENIAKVVKLNGMYWGFSDFMCFSSILLVLIFGIMMVKDSVLTVGELLLFVSYISMIIWPLRQVGRILADLGKVSVAIERIDHVLSQDLEDLETGITPDIHGDISLNDVRFMYDDGVDHVLNGVSMDIKAGQTIAIIGPTGAGKSSLVHLLLRLYDYNSGSISLDGHELKEIQKRYLRENVGIVLQEPFLFTKTIEENIKIAYPNADVSDLQRASRIASVDDVIDSFDLGYQTLVGEKGTTLSGGQKQRMAIARTVINESPILIFDDSLSAVDTETDANIRKALANVSSQTTTIIITQRVSSSKDADNIFVIEDGRITQEGTHEQLVAQEGLYKRINKIQNEFSEGE